MISELRNEIPKYVAMETRKNSEIIQRGSYVACRLRNEISHKATQVTPGGSKITYPAMPNDSRALEVS